MFTNADAVAVTGRWIKATYRTVDGSYTTWAKVHDAYLMERTCPGRGLLGMRATLHYQHLEPQETWLGLDPATDTYQLLDHPPEITPTGHVVS